MTGPQQAIALVGLVLLATAVLGSAARRRYRSWWFFSFYLLAVLVLGSLQQFAPDRFHTPEFWQLKETVYAALRFAMACEVGVRTMRAFPGALATARRMVLLILAVTLAAIVAAPRGDYHSGGMDYASFVGEVVPRMLNGSVWMLMAIGGVILWYRLPVHPFHKAILLSYIPYIIVFTVVSRLLVQQGWSSGGAMQYLNQLAYVALVAYWNYAIWRKDPPRALRGGRGPEERPERFAAA